MKRWRPMMHTKVRLTQAMSLVALALICSCSSIALFSQVAFEQATSLKVDALRLMDHATETFADHRAEVDGLMTRVDKAFEYAKGRPKNALMVKQWEILKDPAGHLLGGFMKRWQSESTLSGTFVTEAKGNVAEAFDEIIGLESGLVRPGDVK